MAKETTIFFIYDTLRVQKEQDDPVTAILYFSPTWVSDSQKNSLCGQLIGTMQCLTKLLACPKIIMLQNGKFCLSIHGRYIMVIGSDRNIDDWILEYRLNILNSLIHFYHKDFEEIANLYDSYTSLSAKIYFIFETYLKILSNNGNIFANIPQMNLPKSAGSCFLEATNLLHSCQNIDHVLGGMVLYHNKVLVTQLSINITKNIVITDPYRIKSPAENIETNFKLPLGIHLLQVYIPSDEFNYLNNNSLKIREMFAKLRKASGKVNKTMVKEPPQSTLRRDSSLIFTSVPEEDNSTDSSEPLAETKSASRPTFLNLKSCFLNNSSIEETETSLCFTPIDSKSGIVAYTPLKDLNRVLHENPVSIIANEELLNDDKPSKICDDIKLKKWASLRNINNNNYKYSKLLNKSKSVIEIDSVMRSCSNEYFQKYYNISINSNETTCTNILSNKKDCKQIKKCQNNTLISDSGPKDCQRNLENNLSESNIDTKSKKISGQNIEKQQKRKSLTLPLKSLTLDTENETLTPAASSGLLTPLMQKLSTPAFEEQRGFGSLKTPIDNSITFSKQSSANLHLDSDIKLDNKDNSLKKCILFICGQQDTTIALLLNEEVANSEDSINILWEICTEVLGALEKQIQHALELAATCEVTTRKENYSFLHLDYDWDTAKRGGHWSDSATSMLSRTHRNFLDYPDMTDFSWRNNDSVIYGFHLEKMTTFFHKQVDAPPGMPPPSDIMGSIPQKARDILEKDENIIIL